MKVKHGLPKGTDKFLSENGTELISADIHPKNITSSLLVYFETFYNS